jgi:hypothetical protein
MASITYEFDVSAEELSFLRATIADCAAVSSLLEGVSGLTLRLTLGEVEDLRDCLTRRLAKVGFDENYAPNADGQSLEELIDRFYVP